VTSWKVQFLDTAANFRQRRLWVLKILIVSKFPQNGGTLSPNFAFFGRRSPTGRKFSNMLKFGESNSVTMPLETRL